MDVRPVVRVLHQEEEASRGKSVLLVGRSLRGQFFSIGGGSSRAAAPSEETGSSSVAAPLSGGGDSSNLTVPSWAISSRESVPSQGGAVSTGSPENLVSELQKQAGIDLNFEKFSAPITRCGNPVTNHSVLANQRNPLYCTKVDRCNEEWHFIVCAVCNARNLYQPGVCPALIHSNVEGPPYLGKGKEYPHLDRHCLGSDAQEEISRNGLCRGRMEGRSFRE